MEEGIEPTHGVVVGGSETRVIAMVTNVSARIFSFLLFRGKCVETEDLL